MERSEKDKGFLFHGGTPLRYFRIAGLFVRFEAGGGERGEGRGREGDGGDGALLVKPKLGND